MIYLNCDAITTHLNREVKSVIQKHDPWETSLLSSCPLRAYV